MSFSRLNYDNDAYVTKLNEIIGVGDYQLGTPRVDCQPCNFYAPGVNLNMFNDGMCEKELIDVDSELIGITRKDSRCPAKKYLPSDKPFCNVKKITKECSYLTPEPTLISNPKATNKETTMNRWEWLCKDPQSRCTIPFDWNINNKLVTRDNHHPCAPKLIDQSAALPPACNKYIKFDWSSKFNLSQNSIPQNALGYCENIQKL